MPVAPERYKTGFTCPSCGNDAQQDWFSFQAVEIKSVSQFYNAVKSTPLPEKVIFGSNVENKLGRISVGNLCVSQCYSCKEFAIWLGNRLIWPINAVSIKPHAQMPAAVKVDFNEAVTIIDRSPRAAGALFRVAFEKLINHLVGEKVKPDRGIQMLVDRGMHERVQKMCDTIRIRTNDHAHLGLIDDNDTVQSAVQIATLINIVVEQTIGLDLLAEQFYSGLPHEKLQFIEDRKRGAAKKLAANPSQAESERPPPSP